MKLLLSLILITFSSLLPAQEVEWLSWEEAIRRNQETPKNILVDVYTDWCGWCKQMDKQVFSNAKVSAYIRKNFYAVKLNAEQQEDITYDDHVFSYDPNQGRRGVHALAVALLDGRMSYPSVVYLDREEKRISVSPGFKPAKDYLRELTFIHEGHFRKMSYEEYVKKEAR